MIQREREREREREEEIQVELKPKKIQEGMGNASSNNIALR